MFFEREEGGERAIAMNVKGLADELCADYEEFILLIDASGTELIARCEVSRKKPHAAFFIGTGVLQELKQQVLSHAIDVVLFNHTLSPSQERNLERELKCRVIDRTGVILDIFAQRARTYEGKLQVELAQLTHISTRLIRGWTHLERQKGGIGLRGPGETQLETDRRLLRERLKSLRAKIDKVRSQRMQNRQPRLKNNIPTVSLVGYTNAGKSSLFNVLTDAQVMAKDMLFATLDPSYRYWLIKEYGKLMLVDTVGFIRALPHRLVEAFSATLEESVFADLLLHIVDCSHEDCSDMMRAVDEVLESIGASTLPVLQVFNKIDLTDEKPRLDRDEFGMPTRVWISVFKQQGLELLEQAVSELLAVCRQEGVLTVPVTLGALRSELYSKQLIKREEYTAEGDFALSLTIEHNVLQALLSRYQLSEDAWQVLDKKLVS